jgi:hypothetical protein
VLSLCGQLACTGQPLEFERLPTLPLKRKRTPSRHLVQKLISRHVIGFDQEKAARPQDPSEFVQQRLLFWHRVKNVVQEDDIHASVG